MLCSDSLVVYVICSQRSLHHPMFVFVTAVLMNSVAGSTVFYPKLLVDLLRGVRSVQVTLRVCMCEAWLLYSLGTSSFLLLAAMSFDRAVLSVCLQRSRSFSSKALSTCLPHLLVFCNYSVSTGVEVLQRRLQAGSQPTASVLTSIFQVMIPTVFNPVVYGLKVTEIRAQLRRLLGCQRAD
uniref:G-protein coupled receptors family 1 profile domain-containing protein n=1 Tax=Astatotilapia calliptera TaxID=8154 RepID=A0AAX7SUK3_ASTCA